MGYSLTGTKRILDDRSLFEGKDILTLGVLYPAFTESDRRKLNKTGLNLNCSKEIFSKQLFVENLGAQSCQSLDLDAYQGAEVLANLNEQISSDFYEKYDVVLDLGTLEHLSNMPVAINNIFSLLKPGGSYYFGLPCNNWVDHGFFQFSPTFFKDICFTNENLELVNCKLETGSTLIDVSDNNLLSYSAYKIKNKMAVLGEIKKLYSSEISFDISQEKYRVLYAQGSKSSLTQESYFSKLRPLLGKLLVNSSFIPFGMKKKIIEIMDLLRRS